MLEKKFQLHDRVRKTKGSSWLGKVCGFYSTSLTPVGYAVESEREPGSVQIYPEAALELVPEDAAAPDKCPCGDNDGLWCSLPGCPYPRSNTRDGAAASISKIETAAPVFASISKIGALAPDLPVANSGGDTKLSDDASLGFQNHAKLSRQCQKADPPAPEPQAPLELGPKETLASSGKPRLCLDHGDELVAGHPSGFGETGLTYEGNQPDLAAELDGEVGGLEHDGPPLSEDDSTDIDADLLLKVAAPSTPAPVSQEGYSISANPVKEDADHGVSNAEDQAAQAAVHCRLSGLRRASASVATDGSRDADHLDDGLSDLQLIAASPAPVSNPEGAGD